jgi:hypothetical protein
LFLETRDRESDCAAGSFRPLDPHLATIQFHDSLDNGQTDPVAWLNGHQQTDKRLKHSSALGRRDSNSVILYGKHHHRILYVPPDFDYRCLPLSSDFKRVRDKIVEDLPDIGPVTGDER